MSQLHKLMLSYEVLYIDQDVVYKSKIHNKTTITRQDRVHHAATHIQGDLQMTPYPTNTTIISRSLLPNARKAGIEDLRGTDMIWAGAIISDKAQERRYTCFSSKVSVYHVFFGD